MDEKRLDKLEEKVDLITNNHLAHLKEDFFELKSVVGVVSTNVTWLLKFFWVAATASVGSLVAAIMGLIIK